MGRESNVRGATRRAPLSIAAMLALMGSATALAAQPPIASSEGIMKFEHVRVVNAPIAENTQAVPQAGMRAYIDADTGALRAPTPEEMQAAAAEQPAAQSAVQSRRLRAAPMTAISPASGGIGMKLDESFMQYSVVMRQPDGTLGEICVTGSEKANEVLKANPVLKAAQREESTNDR